MGCHPYGHAVGERVGEMMRRLTGRGEFRLVAVRESRFRDEQPVVETPAAAAKYWEWHIATGPEFDPQAKARWRCS